MKVRLVQNLRCECGSTLMYDDINWTVHCGNSRCGNFNQKHIAPTIDLLPVGAPVVAEPEPVQETAADKWRNRKGR